MFVILGIHLIQITKYALMGLHEFCFTLLLERKAPKIQQQLSFHFMEPDQIFCKRLTFLFACGLPFVLPKHLCHYD